jgi:hypothetical protein
MARPSFASARLGGARLQGERHRQASQPCCDALLLVPSSPNARAPGFRSTGVALAAPPAPGVAGFVICDGAGGSEKVARGAQRAAHATWSALLALWREHRRRLRLPSSNTAFMPGHMHRRFLATFRTASAPAPPGIDHTALACLWDRHHLLVARVGDSSLLLRRHGRWEMPLAPQKGEAANETVFLRPSLAPWLVGLCCLPTDGIEAVIGFSDGLEAAFLSPTPGEPSRPAINAPLADLVLHHHRGRCGWRGYSAWLEQSLADQSLAQLSDDDRTLVIASR